MGYEFLFNKTLITLFSVPNFMGEFDNFGAVMVVEEGLKCSFEMLKPKKCRNVKFTEKTSIPKK